MNMPPKRSPPDTLPPSSYLPTLTPAASPRTTPRSSRPSTTAAAAQIAARSAQRAAAHSTGSPHRPGQRPSAHISATCATVLPQTVTVALPRPGSAAGIGGGGARRARSSTSSPATRTAKRSGGAAARNMAVCEDDAVSWRRRCGRCAGGDAGPLRSGGGGKTVREPTEGDGSRCTLSLCVIMVSFAGLFKRR